MFYLQVGTYEYIHDDENGQIYECDVLATNWVDETVTVGYDVDDEFKRRTVSVEDLVRTYEEVLKNAALIF